MCFELFDAGLQLVSNLFGNHYSTEAEMGTDRISLQSISQTRLDRIDSPQQVLILGLKVLFALVRLIQFLFQTSNLLLMVALRTIRCSCILLALNTLETFSELSDFLA